MTATAYAKERITPLADTVKQLRPALTQSGIRSRRPISLGMSQIWDASTFDSWSAPAAVSIANERTREFVLDPKVLRNLQLGHSSRQSTRTP